MNTYEAIKITMKELEKWGLSHWKVSLNNRLTRALGRCVYSRNEIELQRRYVQENSVEIVLDTIRHEIAHALAGHKAGHGPEWKMWAIKVGAVPEATVDSKTINLKRKYQLAFVKDEDCKRVHERLDFFSDRKVSLRGRGLKGRPETFDRLIWVDNK